MNLNCCLSLSDFPPLAQYCECTFFSVLFKVKLVFIYMKSLVFLLLSTIQPHLPFVYPLCLSLIHNVLNYHIFQFFYQLSFMSSLHFPKGPFFRYQTYFDWLRQPNPQVLPGWELCLQRLRLVPIYCALFLAVSFVFPLAYVRSDDFLDHNFFFRYC